jgi:ArsR family transcriptional regulator
MSVHEKEYSPSCETFAFDKDKVERVFSQMIKEGEALELASTFKALGDQTRSKILYALSKEELCVCDISVLLNMSESAISHHLRVLRSLRLVKHRKEGRMVFYSLDDEHILNLLEECLSHVRHS